MTKNNLQLKSNKTIWVLIDSKTKHKLTVNQSYKYYENKETV